MDLRWDTLTSLNGSGGLLVTLRSLPNAQTSNQFIQPQIEGGTEFEKGLDGHGLTVLDPVELVEVKAVLGDHLSVRQAAVGAKFLDVSAQLAKKTLVLILHCNPDLLRVFEYSSAISARFILPLESGGTEQGIVHI